MAFISYQNDAVTVSFSEGISPSVFPEVQDRLFILSPGSYTPVMSQILDTRTQF